MEKDQEPPFPRESWQRLLQDRADAPPETTDARIRAAARKAVAPGAARWVLPASLAASFLLAVLIVRSQYGNEGNPAVVTEKDLAAPTAAAPPSALSPDLARERAADSAAPARKESVPSELHYNVAPEDFPAEPEADSGEERQDSANGTRVSGPEQELKAASEMDSEVAGSADATRESGLWAGAKREAPVAAASAPTAVQARTPEAWYADIEALRKAGRIEEADAELARFEAAYPEWLKQQGRRKP